MAVGLLTLTLLSQCCSRRMLPESDAKRLYEDKLRHSGYNKLIRPVGNTTDTLTVRMGLRLTQIIDVVSSTLAVCGVKYRHFTEQSISRGVYIIVTSIFFPWHKLYC